MRESQYVEIGTQVMLNAIVYSAVIVVQMTKIAQKGYWDYPLKTSNAR